ncbi:MAG: glutathione synthase [Myxococcales bacterium]|nr:glutathione synthase [Myxococcales bacterium]MCH7867966.1 glutathione synthase [Myxococcales bacterium]
MRPRQLTMAFVMDPVTQLDISADTTFVLMLEAQRRGHEVLYVDQADLSIENGQAAALVTPVTLRVEEENFVDLGPARRVILDDEVDVAFQRKDPPVDPAYIAATQILGTCRKTLVLNRPEAILAFNEKLFALHFPDLMPRTTVTRSIAELQSFMEALGGEMIVKPLNGKGGEGVFHLVAGEKNISSILEQSTQFETSLVMAQEYLPAIRLGDKRILLLEGEAIGAVLRVPADAEVRANLHVGARAEKADLSPADREIIRRLGPILKREGLFFVGIDVIGDRLTEINVTSPTGIQEINALDSACLEAKVIDAVEARVAAGAGDADG